MSSSTNTPKHIRVEQTREVRTYAEMWHGSHVMLKIADEYGKGQHWLYLSSILMTAFTFEAYLNHVGPQIDPSWNQKDRLNYREKFDDLAITLGVVFPGGWGSDPLQTIGALFKFRDRIAHGRSERLSPKPETVKLNGDIEDYFNTRPATEWEKHLIDDQFARRARERVEVVLERLHAARTDDKEAMFMMGMTIGSASAA